MTYIERLRTAYSLINDLDKIEVIVGRIENLGTVLGRLESIEKTLATCQPLENLADRLGALNNAVTKIETLQGVVPTDEIVNKTIHPVKQDLMEWNRLKLLAKFVQLADKGQEIEQEWQRIQQNEHDFEFAFHSTPSEETQGQYLFKKGIAEGIKWCVNRFS